MIKGFFQARKWLKKERVGCVIATGGFVTIPVVFAAKSCFIPIILLEQNVLPGRANRVLNYLANRLCLSFEESKKYMPGTNKVNT